MSEKNNLIWVAIIIALIALIIPLTGIIQNENVNSENKNSVTVSGESQMSVTPDKAEIYFRVTTTSRSSSQAQEENTRKANNVINAIKEAGISEENIETTRYDLDKERRWNPKTNTEEERGYTSAHVVKVTINNIENTGSIINTGVSNGANGIERVNFDLSEESRAEKKNKLLSKAVQDAEEKAKAITNEMNVKLGEPLKVSESSYNIVPYQARNDVAYESGAGSSQTPQVEPENVRLNAQVSVSYQIS